jgi:hypothetical protein
VGLHSQAQPGESGRPGAGPDFQGAQQRGARNGILTGIMKKRGWLIAVVVLVVVAAGGAFVVGRRSRQHPVGQAVSPRTTPTPTPTPTASATPTATATPDTSSLTPATPTATAGDFGPPTPTTETGLSVQATFDRSCGGVIYTQCLTQARAAIKTDQTLTRQNCATGAVQACARQFGDPLVQGCFPASDAQGPAWGPDGWCTLVNNLLVGG